MAEFINLVLKFIKKMAEGIKEKGSKAVIQILSIITFVFIFALIFISPSYIFMFFYERSLFLEFRLIINIGTILISDSILFLVLVFICSTREMKLDIESGKILTEDCTTPKDIVRTILLMLLISVALLIVYGVFIMIGINVTTKIGVVVVGAILSIILNHYIRHYRKIKRKATILQSANEIRNRN